MVRTLFISILILVYGTVFVGAQATTERMAEAAKPGISHPLPFKVGETLLYEINFSKFIFGGTIGDLRMSVAKATDAKNPRLIELKAEAVSRGFFSKLFGLKVNDRFSAIVNPDDLGLHTSIKLIEEGKLRREQKSVIDREAGRVTYVERDLSNRSASPQVKEADSPRWIQDAVSATYFLRTQELKQGDVIAIPISDGGNVYNIEVVVGKREEIKVDAGRFKTIQLEARIFDGRYIRRSGQLFIWVSDDARRIPVRAKIKVSGTTVNIDLKRIEGV
jgi:hypothetical protein